MRLKAVIFLRRIWEDEEGALDVRVSYQHPEALIYSLVRALGFARRAGGSLPACLRDFYFEEAADSDSRATVDCFPSKESGTPVCEDFEMVVDNEGCIHFLPFQFQSEMSAKAWCEVAPIWHSFLVAAPLDEDSRMNWQVCVPLAKLS